MAEAAVSFAVERLGDLLIAEARFLSGVKTQVENARSQLEMMRCFLEDADAYVRHGDLRVRNWVKQTREAAYDLEDVIEAFVLKVVSRRERGVKNFVRRSAGILNEGIELHKVGSEIDNICSRISGLASALETHGVRKLRFKEGTSSSIQRLRELRRAYSHVDEQDVVGLDKDIMELVAELTENENCQRHVISICGMGGLGKTTLARKVYHHPQVRSHFDCFAWASISQQCEIRTVWEEILISLTSPTMQRREEIARMKDGEIAKELYNVQKDRRCLVLLDDIWTTSTWDRLKAAFPEDETADSKILLTTRQKNVALHADKNGLLHQPRCLDENESWELFVKKSFFGKDATNSEDNERMKELGREMLGHCAGLPLAIIVLGGLLSAKHTVHEWEALNKNVKSYISRGNEHGEQEYRGVSSVLGLSYDELPYYLKPCFLYLASYPEDFWIEVKTLCHLLIAEGFISLKHQRSSTETIEDIAYEYLSKLVDRHMIQVQGRGSTGRMKAINVHDLMRDLCLFKAQEENFLQFVDLRSRDEAIEPFSFGTGTNAGQTNKVRRVAVYANHRVDDLLPFIDNRDGSLRSLTFVNMQRVEPREQVLKPLFKRFQMLRVLNLRNMITSDRGKVPKEIGKLIHLRFLSFNNIDVEKIPSSIGNLRCLQTLDIQARIKDWKVPNVMWRMEQLRHLYLPMSYHLRGKYLRLTNVSNLQTLSVVPTKYLDMNDFLRLKNLKKLGICVDKNLGRLFCNYRTVTFNCLRTLVVYNKEEDEVDIVPVILSYPQIYKLSLFSPITKLPEDYQFSPNLMKLVVGDTLLKDDPMTTLEKLPNLRVLSVCVNTFVGSEMVCSKGGFARLEFLEFHSLYNLKEWRVEEGALKSLRHLRIFNCLKLRMVPDGLRFITALKEMEIEAMPKKFKARLQEGGEDFYKVQHVPSLVFLTRDDIQETSDIED